MAAHPVPSGHRMSAEEFGEAADVSRETLERLSIYAETLRSWQAKINLVSPASLAFLWSRHMLDSAQLVGHIPTGTKIITDLGSGAGFPGLVIAIITGIETHLVEADTRKAAFLREVVRKTHASAEIHNGRVENITPWPSDVITARALAKLPKLLAYAAPFLKSSPDPEGSTCLFPKGATWREELTEAEESWHIQCQEQVSVTDPAGRILILNSPTPKPSGQISPR
jgi:16S rRNA (guanine527-N7)-methyltransferase